jgi:Na+/melibiose symporter-like transporter
MNTPQQTYLKQKYDTPIPVYEELPQTLKRRSRNILFLKLRLGGAWICITILNIRLAESSRVHAFHYFRKHSQAYPVFIFGVLFWGALLALPVAVLPFRKYAYKHRYLICAFLIMVLMNAIYLLSFAGFALFVR